MKFGVQHAPRGLSLSSNTAASVGPSLLQTQLLERGPGSFFFLAQPLPRVWVRLWVEHMAPK